MNWMLVMLAFVPISTALHLFHVNPVWVFAASALAILPLAGFMGTATEELAKRFGASIGGLLNATFGNAAELISVLAVAVTNGLRVDDIVDSLLVHPSLAELLADAAS